MRVIVEIPRKPLAKITGALYLAFVGSLIVADMFSHTGVSGVDLAYKALTTESTQFVVGLTLSLLSAFLFIMAAWDLFVLLRPVNRELALLFLLLNAIGVAVQMASYIPLVFAIAAADSSGFNSAFSAVQIESLQRLSIEVQSLSFVTAQLFFGAWLFPLGYLVYKSRFLPRFLGVLLILDGVTILFWFFQAMLLPEFAAWSTPGLVLSFVAEVGLGLWLLVKGVEDVEADARADSD